MPHRYEALSGNIRGCLRCSWRSALHVKQYNITPGPCRSGVSCFVCGVGDKVRN